MKRFLATLALLFPLGASAVVIDFEAIPDPGTVTNQYPGVVFSSPGSSVEVSTYGQSWGTAAPKIACPRDAGSYCGGVFVVDFLSAASGLTFLATGDNFNGIIGTAKIFNGAIELSSVDILGDGVQDTAHLVDFGAFSNITRLEVTVSQREFAVAGLGYDDLTFNASNNVPEPGILALMALGLLGFSFRRTRQ